MKTIKVVAAVICDNMKKRIKFLQRLVVTVSRKVAGSFLEEKSKQVEHLRKH